MGAIELVPLQWKDRTPVQMLLALPHPERNPPAEIRLCVSEGNRAHE